MQKVVSWTINKIKGSCLTTKKRVGVKVSSDSNIKPNQISGDNKRRA